MRENKIFKSGFATFYVEQFGFFFQQQYILVFHWSGRHQRSHQRVCDCHNPFKAQCSRVLDVKPTPSSQPVWKNTSFVMDWCKNSPSKNVPKSEFNLNALLLNCTHLNIKGSMASCTPIQTYDKVKMTFHKVKNNSKIKNFNCTLGKDFLSKDSVSKKVRIFDTNETR